MYVPKKDAVKILEEFHHEFCDTLDQKKETLFKIVKEDDWSFVIKMHAFIEAMVTELILTQVDDDRLRPTIERLALSEEQAGKLKMAKDLGLLDSNERKFIKTFSTLRNNLAHRIDNMDFSFEKYIDSLNKNQKRSWADTISWYAKEDTKRHYQEQALLAPKIVIFIGIFVMSGVKQVKEMELITSRKLDKLAKETTKKIIDEF